MINFKKNLVVIIAVLILLIGVGIGFWMGNAKYSSPSGGQAQDKNIVPASGNEKTFVGEFKVFRVIDGDTIEIEGGERVRY